MTRVLFSAVASLKERFGRRGWAVEPLHARPIACCWIAIIIVMAATGCTNAPKTVLEELSEARRLSADLLVQFTQAADAANRAVMADTDEASVVFAGEAERATQSVQRDIDTLRPILLDLSYSDEARLLEEFGKRFGEYRALDRSVLELAVENTNLKAQKLSFGDAQEVADAFRDSLEAVVPSASAKDTWHVEALVATAVARVRDIQVLQPPHIAESDETAMSDMEKRMAISEAAARSALETLAGLVGPASNARLVAAAAALDRFMGVNAQIVTLSRRNSNVRSLALSLGQKRVLIASCEDSLRALREALSRRGFNATR